MSGETIYPRHPRQPTGQVPQAAVADSDRQETVALSAKAPKWLLPSLIALLAGGGVGTGAMSVVQGLNPTPVNLAPSVTKADLDALSVQSKAQADQAAAVLRAEMQADRQQTAKQFADVATRLDRIDKKLDDFSASVVELKVDVATLAARRR